jgi:predicted dehydrogenase
MSHRICHIGCGGISDAGHGPALARYAKDSPDTVLAACCDLEKGRAEHFAAKFGFKESYSDLELMLQEHKPDAVSLAVPVDKTMEMAVRILGLGFNILMEKPPGMTGAQFDEIETAAAKSGKSAAAAFNRRYMPVMMKLSSILDREGRGITDIRYDFTRTGRRDADFSTTAIHAIDAAVFIAGCGFREYGIVIEKFKEGIGNIHITGKMESGAFVQLNFIPDGGLNLEHATVSLPSRTCRVKIPVWGNIDYPGEVEFYDGGEEKDKYIPHTEAAYVNAGFYFEQKLFHDAVRKGEGPAYSLKEHRMPVIMMEELRGKLSGR